MEAIDFTQMLRDERRRSKTKKKRDKDGQNINSIASSNSNGSQQTENIQPQAEQKETAGESNRSGGLLSPIVPHASAKVPAIDFTTLLRDERQKAHKSQSSGKIQQEGNHSNTLRPPWPHEGSSLSFENLDLKLVCENNPKSIYYSPQVLKDPRPLQEWLNQLPSGDSGLAKWKTMTYGKRRVCMFGEKEGEEGLPAPLQEIAQELVNRGIFSSDQPPNHVLLNDYQPSQGILPHTDGPLYASRTATLSLGSQVVLEFTKRLSSDQIGVVERSDESIVQILLHAGSLIVFQDEAYEKYCHGIPMDVWQDTTTSHCVNAPSGIDVPRGRRFSLTFRHKLRAPG
jgi:hypothetical protein